MIARVKQESAGFTLLEVLVAVAIVGTALVILLGSVNGGLVMAQRSNQMTIAANLGQARMAEILSGPFPELGNDEGDFGEDYPGFEWAAEFTIPEELLNSFEPDIFVQDPNDARAITLVVTHTVGDQEQQLILTQLLFRR